MVFIRHSIPHHPLAGIPHQIAEFCFFQILGTLSAPTAPGALLPQQYWPPQDVTPFYGGYWPHTQNQPPSGPQPYHPQQAQTSWPENPPPTGGVQGREDPLPSGGGVDPPTAGGLASANYIMYVGLGCHGDCHSLVIDSSISREHYSTIWKKIWR